MSMLSLQMVLASALVAAGLMASSPVLGGTKEPNAPIPGTTLSLDGDGWMIATDPTNTGRAEHWWIKPRPDAKPTWSPRTLQSMFPGYNGVAWYWRDVRVARNPHSGGRYLLKFWDVDYYADVWVNGTLVGSHEGLHCPFTFDITDAAKPGAINRIAVRVIYPGNQPIDGFTFGETAHSWAGSAVSGGIMDSVELIVTPAVRIEDIHVIPDPRTGKIAVEASIHNAGKGATTGNLVLSAGAATGGGAIVATKVGQTFAPGITLVKTLLKVANHRLWDINDPYLYRVTARVATEGSSSVDESSTRCGFRDFRFENGYFRLNGRRIFLRSSHTGPEGPVGGVVPQDPAISRSEMLSCKAMGFNMMRFLGRVPLRSQLEIADEIGLMIYEESSASWLFTDSTKMAERFDRQVEGMIRRDRNHPCIVMWGMLNETGQGNVFNHAVNTLPFVRSLDKSRVVMLGSGRFDAVGNFINGLEVWKPTEGTMPNLLHNPKSYGIYAVPLWPAKSVSLNPGASGEYSVARWTAPLAGNYTVSAKFRGTGCFSTTDLHVLRGGKPVYDGFINVRGWGDSYDYADTLRLAAGETLDFAVGWAGSLAGSMGLNPWTDNTQISATIKSSDGQTFDLAADFSNSRNPNGPWSYGWLKPGPAPDYTTFTAYAKCEAEKNLCVGDISNPGSNEWEPVLGDLHTYARSPHRALEIERLRTVGIDDNHVFLSEYGLGSGVNWPRLLRHYEALGEESHSNAQAIRDMYAELMADWDRWKLGDTFASPEDFLDKCLAKMANLRKMGINALRSNPNIISYSLTGTHDPFWWGEGVLTLFREHKPGTFDAMCDSFAPLRWCLFAEPVSLYRGRNVKLEAVIANEDVLKPGEYPAVVQVLGPQDERIFERQVTVNIPEKVGDSEVPFAIPVFSEEVPIDGPSGKYRLVARLMKGAAASGESVEFYVTDSRDMPSVNTEVVLWGEDTELVKKLKAMGIKTTPFASGTPTKREVILVSALPNGAGDANAWRELVERMARGSAVVFLCPEVFLKGEDRLGWLPVTTKGAVEGGNHMGLVNEYTWAQVYIRDEWAKRHPIFEGLPTGLMDYSFYREIIPDYRYFGQDTPDEAVAGAFRTSAGYGSELMVSVYKLGSGRLILNSLRIRQSLGEDPTAERLLRNMLNYAAKDTIKPLDPLPADFETLLKSIGY